MINTLMHSFDFIEHKMNMFIDVCIFAVTMHHVVMTIQLDNQTI